MAADDASRHRSSADEVLVWDLPVRLGHWLLVVLFFVAYLTEDDLLALHSWAGYGVGVYLVARLIWGLIGPEHARFADFAYGPASAGRYLEDLLLARARRYLGHSPAGALMIYALLVCLALTTLTGIALLAVEENEGPLAPWLGPSAAVVTVMAPAAAGENEDDEGDGDDDDDGGGAEALEEVHEVLSDLTLLLVVLHVLGVTATSIVHRENLVRAMITGRKRAHPGPRSGGDG